MEATRGCKASQPAKGPLRPGTVAAAIARESPLEDTASTAGPTCSVGGGGGGVQHRVGQVVPLQSRGVDAEDTLVRGFLRFKASAAPSRFLFSAGGQWRDFCAVMVGILREGFLAGRVIMDVKYGDSLILFDFLRMLRINAVTNCRTYIAWIDATGRCFFPGACTEIRVLPPKMETEARTGENGGTATSGECNETKDLSPEQIQEHSDESQVIPAAGSVERQRWPGAQVLDKEDNCYKAVENVFLTGMRKFAPWTTITSISKCSHAGPSAKGRFKTFMAQVEMTKAARGDAHLKGGWYGSSASDITSIISHGFGHPNNTSLGPEAQAVGVYLAQQDSPQASSLLAEADDVGERHVILCRIITGNVEKVDTHTAQYHPSSDEFDCGVDDLEKPKWYIVWSTHMNAHILPVYIVGFKTFEGPALKVDCAKKIPPRLLGLSFPKLFAEIGNSLPSTKMEALETLYERFKAGKIPKEIFLKNVRAIAGEKLLIATIKRYHNRQ